jgi:rhodanese-related sulfurtransferase
MTANILLWVIEKHKYLKILENMLRFVKKRNHRFLIFYRRRAKLSANLEILSARSPNMIKSIDANELKTMLEEKKDFILIDCREQEEWNEGHIAGAQFMPLSNFQNEVKKLENFKGKTIVAQCRSGKRSLNLCMYLMGEGFEDLTNLEGGILGWMDAGYPIQK